MFGYIVLRKPKLNFDEEGRGAFLSSPPCLGNLYYSGIDRMPWFDIDDDYYDGLLKPESKKLREKLINQSSSLLFLIFRCVSMKKMRISCLNIVIRITMN